MTDGPLGTRIYDDELSFNSGQKVVIKKKRGRLLINRTEEGTYRRQVLKLYVQHASYRFLSSVHLNYICRASFL